MTPNEILTLLALLLGPLIGIRVQTWIDNRKRKRDRREAIFKTLMVTRGSALSLKHVEALNAIDIEFVGPGDRKVRDAWKAYLDHLNDRGIQDPNATQEFRNRWSEKTADLLARLLREMSLAVGYDFDETYIKRAAYTPQRHAEVELDQDLTRKLLLQVLSGQKPLPVALLGGQGTEEQQKLTKLLIEHYEGHRPTNVRIVDQPPTPKLIPDKSTVQHNPIS